MATAHELDGYQLIDRERLEAIRLEYSMSEYSMPEYSGLQRSRAVGSIHRYLPIVTLELATLFSIVGILLWMGARASVGTEADTVPHDDEGEPNEAPPP